MKKKVLISGAGIAGLTMAYWLCRYGYKVTVVEISSAPKKGGAAIDVRGGALHVAERMGIQHKIKAARINTAVEFVNAQNECVGAIKSFGGDAEGRDIELNRNDLLEIIYEAATGDIEYLFNDRIQSMDQDIDTVSVTFKSGATRNFDLVFGADGIHSTARKTVFGDGLLFKHFFGAYFAILKTDESLEKETTGQIYNMPGKMAATNNKGNFMLFFRSPRLDFDYRDVAGFKHILVENFENCGWKIPGILTEMINSDNLYFDELCQVQMPGWTKGRVALIGDAAYCAGFPTGMGTTLAMQGATVLADELIASNGDHDPAFSNYHNRLQPLAATAQATISAGINFLAPATEDEIRSRNEMMY